MMDNYHSANVPNNQMQEGLPLEYYDSLSADEIVHKLGKLSLEEVEKLCRYEKAHKKRRSLLRYLQGRIGEVPLLQPRADEKTHRQARRGPKRGAKPS